MSKVLLVFWPEKGNVETAADKMIRRIGQVEFRKVSVIHVTANLLKEFDNWVIGGSTVGSHVWEDADDSNRWFEFFKLLDDVDLTKKVVAFYGLGDQILYPHHFVDGLAVFQEEFEKRHAVIIGQWPVDGYQFSDSDGMAKKNFYGLALDEDRQPELTEERIDKWFAIIGKQFI